MGPFDLRGCFYGYYLCKFSLLDGLPIGLMGPTFDGPQNWRLRRDICCCEWHRAHRRAAIVGQEIKFNRFRLQSNYATFCGLEFEYIPHTWDDMRSPLTSSWIRGPRKRSRSERVGQAAPRARLTGARSRMKCIHASIGRVLICVLECAYCARTVRANDAPVANSALVLVR